MSPILDLQRRIREAGRIRAGDQVGEGRSRHPRKLEKFRLTSSDRVVLERCAQEFGGEVREWTDAPSADQYELFTDTNTLAVFVPPGELSFSQWYELWNAGGCVRRCDGRTNVIADGPCECDPRDRECAITTRLSVMLRDIEGLGVWRLESHGYYAASELAGVVDLLDAASTRGHLLPATLRLEPRTVKRIDSKTGKPVTRNFVVPTLDVRLSVQALLLGEAGDSADGVTVAATSSRRASLTPVPSALEAPESPTVAEALADTEGAEAPPKRAGTAPEIKSTGRRPTKRSGRTIGSAAATGEPEPEGGSEGPTGPLSLSERAAAMAERARADEMAEPEPGEQDARGGDGFDIERAMLAERLRALPDHIAADVRREWPNVDLPTLKQAAGWTKARIEQCGRLVGAAEARAEDIMRNQRQSCARMARDLGMDDDARHEWVREHFDGAEGLTDLTYAQLVSAEHQLRGLIDARATDEPF